MTSNDLRFVLLLAGGAALAAALVGVTAGGALWLRGVYTEAQQPRTELTVRLATEEIPRRAFQALVDDVRRVVRELRLGFAGTAPSGDNVEVTIRDGVDRQQALATLRELAHPADPKTGAETERFTITEAGGTLLRLAPTKTSIDEEVARARDRTVEVLKQRLNSLGLRPMKLTRSGADLIVIQLPVQPDTTRLKQVIVTAGKLQFRLVDTSANPQDAIQGRVPSDSEVVYEKSKEGDQRIPFVVKKQVMLDGDDLADAQAAYDYRTSDPIVNFKFNNAGARKFGRATQENVGRPFAIVLDNEVISAPVIREPILGGQGQISGNFTVESASNLAILLRSGALPAPLTIIEERTIEP